MATNPILVNPSSIARLLVTIAVLLVIASVGGQLAATFTGHTNIYGLVPLFCVDLEQNVPTFFSTFLLLFAALLLAVITALEKKRAASGVSHWAILSLGFFLMAGDEASSVHELLTRPMRMLLGDGNLGIFNFAWVIPGIVIVLVVALCFLRFWLHLPRKTRLYFLLASVLYIGGAIGFELIAGRHAELHGKEDLTYRLMATVEESLEMSGVITFIWAMLVYLADNHKEVRFGFPTLRRDAKVPTDGDPLP